MPGLGATKMRIKQTSSSGLMGQPSHLRAGWAVNLTVRTRTAFTWILQEIGLMGEARMQRNSSANIKVSQKFMVIFLCFCVYQFSVQSFLRESPRVSCLCRVPRLPRLPRVPWLPRRTRDRDHPLHHNFSGTGGGVADSSQYHSNDLGQKRHGKRDHYKWYKISNININTYLLLWLNCAGRKGTRAPSS